MAEYIIMPKLGFNMDRGIIIKWLKNEGDKVQEREPILQVETDKTVIDVEANIGGVLRKIFLKEGNEVPVTLPIGIIAEKDEDIEKMILEAKVILSSIAKNTEKKEIEQITKMTKLHQKEKKITYARNKEIEVKISPRARKLAKKLNIDLDQLKTYKDAGVIQEKDVEQFNNFQKPEYFKEKINKRISYAGMRKIIGDRLSQSKYSAPHVYFTSSINMQKALFILKKLNEKNAIKITVNDLIVFVVARVLEKYEGINVSLVNNELTYHDSVNVGIAVGIEEGLIVPVIRDANKKDILELSAEIKKLVMLAKQRKLFPEAYEGGTFTISNLGMYGIEHFTAIINPPEAAILAIGTIRSCPIVAMIDATEQIIIQPVMKMTLSVDHRLIDGVKAATFLNEIKKLLENIDNMSNDKLCFDH